VGAAMDNVENGDVGGALTAIGSPSLRYRSFAEQRADAAKGSPTQARTEAEFPLLSAALPESGIGAAKRPVSGAPFGPSVVDNATVLPGTRDEAQEDEPTPRHVAPTPNQPTAQVIASPSLTAPDPMQLSGTALASVFQMLRGQSNQVLQPAKSGLDKLFRKL
jgi:hypothetical protein